MYNENFYEYVEKNSQISAERVFSVVVDVLHPGSVVDFGCAEGTWLSVLHKIDPGIFILGIDGDWVNKSKLKIPAENFYEANLSKSITLKRKFDLAVSFEVAEHIEEQYSDCLIDNITKTADHILFSAAVPGQYGINHVNLQPQSYWIKKFEARGYHVDTSLRNYFWTDEDITWWYRQNLLFFSKGDHVDSHLIAGGEKDIYDVVHPKFFQKKMEDSVRLKELLNWIINHPAEYGMILKSCEDVSKREKKICIYPYGIIGKICKLIFENKYPLEDVGIFDNKLCDFDAEILPVSELRKISKDHIVLECCNNSEYKSEILREVKKYNVNGEVHSIFS